MIRGPGTRDVSWEEPLWYTSENLNMTKELISTSVASIFHC